jgi:hypothetical protein
MRLTERGPLWSKTEIGPRNPDFRSSLKQQTFANAAVTSEKCQEAT